MPERNDLVPFENEIGRRRRRYATATEEELAELATIFPEPFVDHVRRYGWCSIAGGLFWTVSSRHLASGLADWLLDAPVYAFGRNAFGDVYVLCEGRVVTLYATGSTHVHVLDMLDFLNFEINRTDPLREHDVKELRKELGPLNWDDCYTYAPALPISTDGPRRAAVGKLLPYVSIIGQLVAPVRIAGAVTAVGRRLNVKPTGELSAELKALVAEAEEELDRRKREKGY